MTTPGGLVEFQQSRAGPRAAPGRADGATSQFGSEIARHLHLAETTVKTHVARVLAKLQVRDRVQATVLAHRFSLVPGDD